MYSILLLSFSFFTRYPHIIAIYLGVVSLRNRGHCSGFVGEIYTEQMQKSGSR